MHINALGKTSPSKHWQGVGRAWRQRLSKGACIMHPWRRVDATRPTSHAVEAQLGTELEAMDPVLEANGLPLKHDTVDKVRKQRAGISALVNVWWQTVHHDWAPMARTPQWPQWADALLLPLMSWHEQRRCIRGPGHTAQSTLVLQAVVEAVARHPYTLPLPAEVLAGWNTWAGEHARACPRASAAVAGRNG